MKQRFILVLVLCFSVLSMQAQTNWTQIGNDIDGEAVNDVSGWSVSLSANGAVVAIGAVSNDGNGENAGHVRAYENIAGTWTQIGDDIDGETAGDNSGAAVSLSADGSVVAIGAPDNNGNSTEDIGHVRVYENIAGTWTQIGNDIDGEGESDWSGYALSLSADGLVVAIGALYNDDNGTSSGHVRVYENQGGSWVQIGNDIDGEAAGDHSGISVSLSADGLVVASGGVGHVRVYKNQGGSWVQVGNDIDGEASGDGSGYSVSLNTDGSVVAIGAPYNNENGTEAGHVRVYENIAGTWTQIGNDIDGEAAGDRLGHSVSLSADGSVVAIGALFNDGNGTDAGHVRVYENIAGTWTQIGNDIDSEAAGDWSGHSVSLSADGSVVAIGAPLNDGNGLDSGHVRVYQHSSMELGEWVTLAMAVYPNPTKDIVRLTFANNYNVEGLSVLDITGKEVLVKTNIQDAETIDLSAFAKGVYIIKAVTANHKVFVTQVVKQ